MSKWRKVGCCLIAAAAAFGAWADVYRVTSTAASGGNGQAWTDDGAGNAPMTLAEAVVAANTGDTVLLKAGTYVLDEGIALDKSVEIRGGFAGTDDATLTANPYSVLDGQGTVENLVSSSAADGQTVFSHIEFFNAQMRGFLKTGTGDITFEACRFTGNGSNWNTGNTDGGRAIKGSGAARIVCTNCTFAGNAIDLNVAAYAGKAPVWLSGMKQADITDCLFVTNGIAWSRPLGNNQKICYSCGGSALDLNSTPGAVTRCRFIGNRDATMNNFGMTLPSGTLLINGSRCAVSNCLFVANESTCGDSYYLNTQGQGTILVAAGTAAAPVEIVGCTVAYNLGNGNAAGAGLTIFSGVAKVRNSVFYGNRLGVGTEGADVYVRSATANALDLDYSLVTSKELANLKDVAGVIRMGDHVLTGDPGFVSGLSAIDDLVVATGLGTTIAYKNDDETLAAVLALDVHEASGVSQTIDNGDPASDYANEPDPNGNRVNLGFYGNTPEAHVTETAQPEFDGDVAVTFPYGTTQPHVAFTLGGERDYSNAKATLLWSTNGVDFVEILSLDGLVRGATVDRDLPIAFAPTGEITIAVSLTAYGAADKVGGATKSLEGLRYPESYGKGGGTGVVHVRADATGDNSGRDWFNAVTDVGVLATSVGADTREIWFAGTNTCASGKTTGKTSIGRAVAVRGGFTGVENAADERAPGAKAVIDGANVGDPLLIENGAGCPLEVERIVFTRGLSHGFMKSGAGSVFVHDCDFVSNGQVAGTAADSQYGPGAYLVGTAGTTEMSVSNCTFQGNWFVAGNDRRYATGLGLCVENAKRATVEDSLFLTNGVSLTAKNPATTQMGVYGSAFCAKSAPVTVRRCAFRANRGPAYCMIKNSPTSAWTYNGGGTVTLMNGSGGSVFENCLWSGNTSEAYQDYGAGDYNNEYVVSNSVNQGALVVRLDDAAKTVAVSNCTFQGNLMDAWESPCAINVMKGAVTVRNSIFTGNIVGQYAREDLADEIAVTGPGSVSVDWTMFDRPAEKCVSAAAGATAEVGEHVTYGKSARLKTSAEKIFACVVTNDVKLTGIAVTYHYIRFAPELHATVVPNFDAHLGPRSPALDAGDPDSDWSRERRPNGRRVNLGAYGNTSEAKQTFGGMLIVK